MASRARVLTAARGLFEEVGFQGATVRMIAERAGLSPAGVFTTFEDKVAILRHIIGEHRERLFDELARLAPEFEGTCRDRVFQVGSRIYVDEYPRLRLVAAYLGESHAWSQSSEDEFRRLHSRLKAVVQQLLIDGARQGEIGAHVDLDVLHDVISAIHTRNYRTAASSEIGLQGMVDRFAGQLDLVFEGARPRP